MRDFGENSLDQISHLSGRKDKNKTICVGSTQGEQKEAAHSVLLSDICRTTLAMLSHFLTPSQGISAQTLLH